MNITQNIRSLIKKLEVNEKTNFVINGENSLFQIVSSEAMGDNKNKNISIIDFGACEELLKKKYGIDYILILQMDIFLSSSTNIVMKYEVYNPYTLEKIDLSICNNMKIDTYKPFPLAEDDLEFFKNLNDLGYDLLNPNDSFYKDICVKYTTESKTDILLTDRRNNYYKNYEFCEEGCSYIEYDFIGEKVHCECLIKRSIYIISQVINKKFITSRQ